MGNPCDLKSFYDFYYSEFKPIYGHVETLAQPPVEMFFEINAAFDHISRIYQYAENEQKSVESATRHLKRGTFDAFKIILVETSKQYNELKKVDLSSVDCGRFYSELVSLWYQIKAGSIDARNNEGDNTTPEKWEEGFARWKKVYGDCVRFEQEFYLSDKVVWAKRKNRIKMIASFSGGVIAGIISTILYNLLARIMG